MPCNAYGINDNYDLQTSHFFPALIRKIIEAMKNDQNNIKIWGSGKPLRELIFCDDIADACIYFLKKKTNHTLINIGSGIEKSITEYAKFIMNHLGIDLKIKYDSIKLDGTYRKLLSTKVAKKYGWLSRTSLDEGLSLTINDFIKKKIL
tara:strand:- start:56 stop:502 length:447 start_codon:yes stop_codon:yes gene_type:complete